MIELGALIKLRTQAKRFSWESQRSVALANHGKHSAVYRGRGLDFQGLREYTSGDEIRYLDWRVTARTGKPHTKLFCEDRERTVMLMVDLNPSMHFGTQATFKSVIAARAAALLGWTATLHHDQVGGAVISSDAMIEVAPDKSDHALFTLMKAMTRASETGEARPLIFSSLKQKMQRGSLVVLISDFYTFNETLAQACKTLAMQCEVVFIWVYDTLEKNPPSPDCYAITDQKTFSEWDTGSSSLRQAYQKVFQQRQQRLEEFTKRYRISLITLTTQDHVERELPRQWEALGL